MTRIPVYQMILGQDKQGKSGLMFSSEQENTGSQSIIFAIPILDTHHHPFDFIDSFEDMDIYFPFEMEGEYYELKAKIEFPELIFEIPKINTSITFAIDNEGLFSSFFYPFFRRQRRNTKYVGQQSNLIPNNNGFMTLMPIEVQEMDELYLEHKAIFVGMTPNFGSRDNLNRG